MEKKKEKEIERIARKYSLDLILLFGSRASNKFVRKDSDFDIAYLSRKNLNLMDEAKLSTDLIPVLKSFKIDISNLKRAHPLLLKQIFNNHVILFCRDKIIYYKYMIYSERKYAEARPLFKLQDNFNKIFLKNHAR